MSGSGSSWRRNQAAVTVAAFIGFTGFTLVMPFLPLYLQQLGEHDTAAIAIWSGLSLGVTPLVTAFMTPVWARLAERTGRKLMVGRSLFSFVIIMTVMASVSHPWQVFALRCIQGFFAGYGPLAMVLAAESAPRDQMATAIGWVQSAQRLGPALGPVIGGALAATFGLRGAFYVSALFYLVAFLLVMVGFQEPPRQAGTGATAATKTLTWAHFRVLPYFVTAMVTVFALQLVDRSFGPVLPLYLSEMGVPFARVSFYTGVIFTVAAGSAAVGNQMTAWWLTRLPARVLIPLCATVAAVSAAVFGLGPSVLVMGLVSVPFGSAMGIATTALYTAVGQRVEPHERTVAFGYLQTAYLIGLAVSPVVAGFIGARSMRAVFLVDAVGLIILAWYVRRRTALTEAH
jgi:DHA1 family multidrug resistance protein-like MFS transporter